MHMAFLQYLCWILKHNSAPGCIAAFWLPALEQLIVIIPEYA